MKHISIEFAIHLLLTSPNVGSHYIHFSAFSAIIQFVNVSKHLLRNKFGTKPGLHF